ncbi:hypothetical protein [Bacillus sp. B-jedd]|uniref:hypothetical protein n=1 Tax=Bacillus sp. B-jedd TaxID=1476857 RepID=UPI0005156A0C|nr:hypothetical protein [Bacillus sp. B-jedd]CEG29354.1 hypothetical protein BN1002_04292 [Bacillus sp. B-jedd]
MPLKRVGEDDTFIGENLPEKILALVIQKTIKEEMEPIYRTLNEMAGRMKRLEERMGEWEQLCSGQFGIGQISMNTTGSGGGLGQSPQKMEQKAGEGGPSAGSPAVIYQEFRVERLFIEKFDQITNLGNLGIRELSGQLTIGTTYESDAIPEESVKGIKEDQDKMKEIIDEFKQKKEMVEKSGEKE